MRYVLALLVCAAIGGCGSLLPRGSQDTPEGFTNFEQAQAGIERIVALQTSTSELKSFGFDPVAGRNVTLIPYPDIIARLAPHPGVPIDTLDEGIRTCIALQGGCRGYLFRFERQDRRRRGSFWLDFLNLRRTTYVTGWWFEALVVIDDSKVLFRNFAGQASTEKIERQINPLGLLQPAGESVGARLLH